MERSKHRFTSPRIPSSLSCTSRHPAPIQLSTHVWRPEPSSLALPPPRHDHPRKGKGICRSLSEGRLGRPSLKLDLTSLASMDGLCPEGWAPELNRDPTGRHAAADRIGDRAELGHQSFEAWDR